MKALDGVAMELDDCALPLLDGHRDDRPTSTTAFDGTTWALLVGSIPRKAGMERGDLLNVNGGIFKPQGQAINAHAAERRARARGRATRATRTASSRAATRPTCRPTAGSR